MIMDEHEYIVGLLKKDGIDYGDNGVHVTRDEKSNYFVSTGKYKISGDTIANLNFMFKLTIQADDEYGVGINCERRKK